MSGVTLEEQDQSFILNALKELKDIKDQIVGMIRRDNTETLATWREKHEYKINLIIARRLVRLEGEEDRAILEKAKDPQPLEDFLKVHIEDFNRIEDDTISEILTSTAEKDAKFHVAQAVSDKIFRESKPDAASICLRDERRAKKVAGIIQDRKDSMWNLHREHSMLNAALLVGVDDVDIDALESESMGGLGLLEYCKQ